MRAYVLVCGQVFDGLSDTLAGPAEILVENNRIERSAGRPPGARGVVLVDVRRRLDQAPVKMLQSP